jgi:hypothetical protein
MSPSPVPVALRDGESRLCQLGLALEDLEAELGGELDQTALAGIATASGREVVPGDMAGELFSGSCSAP